VARSSGGLMKTSHRIVVTCALAVSFGLGCSSAGSDTNPESNDGASPGDDGQGPASNADGSNPVDAPSTNDMTVPPGDDAAGDDTTTTGGDDANDGSLEDSSDGTAAQGDANDGAAPPADANDGATQEDANDATVSSSDAGDAAIADAGGDTSASSDASDGGTGITDASGSSFDASAFDAGPVSHVCSFFDLKSQSITANGNLTITVPDCFAVTGILSIPSLPLGSTGTSGWVVNAFGAAPNELYPAAITAIDKTHAYYAVAVPTGTYQLAVNLGITFPFQSSPIQGEEMTLAAYPSITVGTADMTNDVALPVVGALQTMDVTVNGFGGVDTSNGLLVEVNLMSSDRTFIATGLSYAITSASVTSLVLPMKMPAGTFNTLVFLSSGNPNGSSANDVHYSSDLIAPDVTVGATATIAIPTVNTLSGTVTDPSSALSSAAAFAQEIDLDPSGFSPTVTPTPPYFGDLELNRAFFATTALTYVGYSRTGQTRQIVPSYLATVGPGGTGNGRENTFETLQPNPGGETVTVTANLTRNYQVPAVPADVAVEGTIVDSHGNAVVGYALQINSFTITGLTGAFGGVDTIASDTLGTFTAHVWPGTYDFMVQYDPGQAPPTNEPPIDAGPDAGPGYPGCTAEPGDDAVCPLAEPNLYFCPSGKPGPCVVFSGEAVCCP
jgi:hypothetical protein